MQKVHNINLNFNSYLIDIVHITSALVGKIVSQIIATK